MIIDAHCHLFSKEIIHPQAPEKFRENIETRNPEKSTGTNE